MHMNKNAMIAPNPIFHKDNEQGRSDAYLYADPPGVSRCVIIFPPLKPPTGTKISHLRGVGTRAHLGGGLLEFQNRFKM